MLRTLLLALAGFGLAVSAETLLDVVTGRRLASVRDEIRRWRAAGEVGPVTVRLAAGRHALDAPLALDARDSDVIWCAAPGAEVRISGGRLLTDAPAPVTDPALLSRLPKKARGKVLAYDLARLGVADWSDYLYNPEDAVQRRVATTWNQGEFVMGSHAAPDAMSQAGRMELFVDDRPMTVARTPKDVSFHVAELLGPIRRTDPVGSTCCSDEGRFTVREEIPVAWTAEPEPYLCGCWCRDWAEQRQRVVRMDRATRTVELSRPYHQYFYKSGTPFFGFNLLCELDEPGEFYLDRATRKLLAWLPAQTARRVELSMAGRLVELTEATNIVFRGVTFEACRNSAVKMAACVNCALEDCTVRNVGQHALIVEDGRDCGARRCRFLDLGGAGAFLVDGNRATLEPSGHFVEDCDIHDFGRWDRMYRPGVCLAGVGMRAVRNRIHDAPHAAILFFGCDLLMQSNEVYRTNRETKDCGAFYSGRSWMLRGNRILDNFFHDIVGLDGHYTRTVYLDDSMADTLVAGNRFTRCTWAVFIGGSRDNVITNNVFIDCPNALYSDARGRGWQRPHIDGRLREMKEKGTLNGLGFTNGVYAARYPAVKTLPAPDPYSPTGNLIAGNDFRRGDDTWIARYGRANIRKSPDWWLDGLSAEELSELGTFADNRVDGRPLDSGACFIGPDGGAFGDARNWSDGRLPTGADEAVVPNGRTVTVRAQDLAALTGFATIRLAGRRAGLDIQTDRALDFPVSGPRFAGSGLVRVSGTGAKPARVSFHQDSSAFAGSFFFTNACVFVHGPQTLGRSCPVTFCKTTAGGDCTFNFAAAGVYSSDLTFIPPKGAMWFAVASPGPAKGTVVNRGRIVVPELYERFCGRIAAQIPFIQEGLMDLGSRVDVTGPVTLRCPVRFTRCGEELFTDAPSGRITLGDGFSLGGGLGLPEGYVKLLEDGNLGSWKVLAAQSDDPSFGARVKRLLPAGWSDGLKISPDGRSVELFRRDIAVPQ